MNPNNLGVQNLSGKEIRLVGDVEDILLPPNSDPPWISALLVRAGTAAFSSGNVAIFSYCSGSVQELTMDLSRGFFLASRNVAEFLQRANVGVAESALRDASGNPLGFGALALPHASIEVSKVADRIVKLLERLECREGPLESLLATVESLMAEALVQEEEACSQALRALAAREGVTTNEFERSLVSNQFAPLAELLGSAIAQSASALRLLSQTWSGQSAYRGLVSKAYRLAWQSPSLLTVENAQSAPETGLPSRTDSPSSPETCEVDGQRTKLFNLTPHPLHIHSSSAAIQLAPSPPAARVQTLAWPQESHLPCRVYQTLSGGVLNLPPPRAGTVYVVSRMISSALPLRSDLLTPAKMIRNRDGKPSGFRYLCRTDAFEAARSCFQKLQPTYERFEAWRRSLGLGVDHTLRHRLELAERLLDQFLQDLQKGNLAQLNPRSFDQLASGASRGRWPDSWRDSVAYWLARLPLRVRSSLEDGNAQISVSGNEIDISTEPVMEAGDD